MVKVCPQCGFKENPDGQEACIICKADLTLVPVVQPRRKLIPRNVALFCVGLGLTSVGFYWFYLSRLLPVFFIAFVGLLMVLYLGGQTRGGHQRLWKSEYPPYETS